MTEIPQRPDWQTLTADIQRDKALGFKVVPAFRKRVLAALKSPDLEPIIELHCLDPNNFNLSLPDNIKDLISQADALIIAIQKSGEWADNHYSGHDDVKQVLTGFHSWLQTLAMLQQQTASEVEAVISPPLPPLQPERSSAGKPARSSEPEEVRSPQQMARDRRLAKRRSNR